MQTVEMLESARDLIREPKDWCQFEMRDYAGRYCAIGALYRAVWGQCTGEEAAKALDAIAERLGTHEEAVGNELVRPSAVYNDTHSHAEVLELFNLAIAAELAKAPEPECLMA